MPRCPVVAAPISPRLARPPRTRGSARRPFIIFKPLDKSIMHGLHPLFTVLLFYLLSTPSQAQLRVVVEGLPAYTPAQDTLYLAGSFNGWEPGNDQFALSRLGDGRYAFEFVTPMPDFNFKLTRGDWERVESGPLTEPIENRHYSANGQLRDTIRLSVAGWEDQADQIAALDSLVVTIKSLPANTPEDARIYLTGSFNGWSPKDEACQFRETDAGLRLTIPLRETKTYYKVSRGSWASIEGRKNGLALPNRAFDLQQAGPIRSTDLRVESWEDLTGVPLGWYTIAKLLAVLQLVLIAIPLLTIRNVHHRANRLLAVLLLSIALAAGLRLLIFDRRVFAIAPKLILLPDLIYFLAGPLLLSITAAYLNRPPPARWKWAPALLAILAYLPFVFTTDFDFTTGIITERWQWWFGLSAGLGWVVTAYFGWRSFRLFEAAAGDEPPAHPVRLLMAYATVALGCWALTLLLGASRYVFPGLPQDLVDGFSNFTWLLLTGSALPVSYLLIKRPEQLGIGVTKRSSNEAASADEVKGGPPPVASPMMEQTKSADAQQLEDFMVDLRPYLDAGLSLAELARRVGMPRYQLSKILNEQFGQNFFEFVNTYRIGEFRERVHRGEHLERTILSIGLESGFNSKTAFNRAFKRYVGMTPKQYVQSLDNQAAKSATLSN